MICRRNVDPALSKVTLLRSTISANRVGDGETGEPSKSTLVMPRVKHADSMYDWPVIQAGVATTRATSAHASSFSTFFEVNVLNAGAGTPNVRRMVSATQDMDPWECTRPLGVPVEPDVKQTNRG
jgi:hypothetical protein